LELCRCKLFDAITPVNGSFPAQSIDPGVVDAKKQIVESDGRDATVAIAMQPMDRRIK